MADNVIIDNVGGMRGVASEATLQSLVEAVRRMGGANPGMDAAAAARLQALYSKALKEGTKAQKDNTAELDKSTFSLKGFTKQAALGDERIASFSEALFGSTSIVTRFAKVVDGLTDEFRSLSSVGASFNNSISDMVMSSVSASMTLDGFTQLIRNNSTQLAFFAGTVTQGAKFLGDFSRDIRLGIGQDFFAMGMTIESINEGLVGFMSIEAMRGRQALRNDTATQESAANYIRQLNLLSKLTGKQAEALEQDIAAMQTDVKMRNIFNEIERTRGVAARQEAEAIYALQQNALPGFNDALLDMADGVAQSDLARALETVAPGITQFQYRLAQGGMSMEEYRDGMARYQTSIASFAGSLSGASIDVYRETGGFVGGLATIADNLYQFNQLVNLDPAAARREAARRNALTARLAQFEQAIIAVRTAFLDAFIQSPFAEALGKASETLFNMFDMNSGRNPFMKAGSNFERIFNYFFGETGFLTRGVRYLARELNEGGKIRKAFDWIGEQFDALGVWISTFLTDAENNGIWNTIKNRFSGFIDWLLGESTGNDGEREGGIVNSIISGASALMDRMIEKLNPIIDRLGEKITNTLTPLIDSLMNQLDTMLVRLGKTLEASLLRAIRGVEIDLPGFDPFPIIGSIGAERLAELESEGFANGTNGFRNFGRQSQTTLHGIEAVVPRNTPAGDVLAEFYKSQKRSTAAPPVSSFSGANQSDLNNKLDQLNTTMQTVAALLSESVNVQHRIKRGIGGIGTDLMRG